MTPFFVPLVAAYLMFNGCTLFDDRQMILLDEEGLKMEGGNLSSSIWTVPQEIERIHRQDEWIKMRLMIVVPEKTASCKVLIENEHHQQSRKNLSKHLIYNYEGKLRILHVCHDELGSPSDNELSNWKLYALVGTVKPKQIKFELCDIRRFKQSRTDEITDRSINCERTCPRHCRDLCHRRTDASKHGASLNDGSSCGRDGDYGETMRLVNRIDLALDYMCRDDCLSKETINLDTSTVPSTTAPVASATSTTDSTGWSSNQEDWLSVQCSGSLFWPTFALICLLVCNITVESLSLKPTELMDQEGRQKNWPLHVLFHALAKFFSSCLALVYCGVLVNYLGCEYKLDIFDELSLVLYELLLIHIILDLMEAIISTPMRPTSHNSSATPRTNTRSCVQSLLYSKTVFRALIYVPLALSRYYVHHTKKTIFRNVSKDYMTLMMHPYNDASTNTGEQALAMWTSIAVLSAVVLACLLRWILCSCYSPVRRAKPFCPEKVVLLIGLFYVASRATRTNPNPLAIIVFWEILLTLLELYSLLSNKFNKITREPNDQETGVQLTETGRAQARDLRISGLKLM